MLRETRPVVGDPAHMALTWRSHDVHLGRPATVQWKWRRTSLRPPTRGNGAMPKEKGTAGLQTGFPIMKIGMEKEGSGVGAGSVRPERPRLAQRRKETSQGGAYGTRRNRAARAPC